MRMEGSHFSAKILKFLMPTYKIKWHLFCQHDSKRKALHTQCFSFWRRHPFIEPRSAYQTKSDALLFTFYPTTSGSEMQPNPVRIRRSEIGKLACQAESERIFAPRAKFRGIVFQLTPPLAEEIHLRWMKSLRDKILLRKVKERRI